MNGFCKLIVAGNLTRDPELRYTPKGTAVAKAGVAVNRTWTNDSGEKKEDVTFIDWEAWGRTGETLAQYTRKGNAILLEGRLALDQWEDKNTHEKRSKLKMVVESFRFLEFNKQDGEQNDRRPAARPAASSRPAPSGPPIAGDEPPESDDVPF